MSDKHDSQKSRCVSANPQQQGKQNKTKNNNSRGASNKPNSQKSRCFSNNNTTRKANKTKKQKKTPDFFYVSRGTLQRFTTKTVVRIMSTVHAREAQKSNAMLPIYSVVVQHSTTVCCKTVAKNSSQDSSFRSVCGAIPSGTIFSQLAQRRWSLAATEPQKKTPRALQRS